ncbi:flavodoxin [bacterium 1XD42-54]|jgi:flavodoxin|nr:flavodoxin [bacterium 1XD42-54]
MKKKLFAVMMASMLTFALAACGNTGNNGEESTIPEPSTMKAPVVETESESETEESTLPADTSEEATESETELEDMAVTGVVVYFSWSGNTEAVAAEIQNQTGADTFRLVPAEPYTDDYDALLDIAQEEQRNGARPAISGSIENFDSYEVVYLGFPNWWGDMPMILYSFLDDYDLSGKTIVPFVTSGGSGFSNTIRTIESMEPDAEVLDGLSLGSSQAANAGDAVANWLSGLGLVE